MAQKSVGSGRPSDAHAASMAGARMIERAQESVVRVRREGNGTGTGVVWDRDLVLTNHHVVAGWRGGKARVTLRDGRSFDVEVARRGRGWTWRYCASLTEPAICRSRPLATPTGSASASWSTPSGTPGEGSGR